MENKKSEDLGLVVKSKEFALWTDVVEGAKKEIEETEDNYFKIMEFQKAVLKLANEKLEKLD